MSPRRLFPVIASGVLVAGFACACVPWSVAMPGLVDRVAREFRHSYGVALSVEGPTEVALLPLPRIAFSRVRLDAGARGGPVLAEGGTLSLQVNLLALLAGRIDINTLSLDGAAVHLPESDDDTRWAGPIRQLTRQVSAEGGSHPRRISLSRMTVTGRDPRDGSPQTARAVDLTLSWPLWSDRVDLAGGFTWNAVPARFTLTGVRLTDLLAGEPSPFAASAEWPAGTLSAEGTGKIGDGLKLTGRGTLQTRSLPETLAWAGGDVALSPFIERFGLDGSFETDGWVVSLPTIRVSVGSDRLEGAGSVAFGDGRPTVQATLAAETLNLAPLLAGVMRVFGLDQPDADANDWRGHSVALRPLTGGDLDLRISSGGARLGPLMLTDLAASLLVRDGSIEAALNRATVEGATLKGRVALTANADAPDQTEVKAQASFDRLDLGEFLGTLGQERWVVGDAQGQMFVEGTGATAGALMGHVNGHAALSVDRGTIAGVDLTDVVHRNGAVASGALARRNARTPFERAGVTVRFTDGIGQIADGVLKATALSASLTGAVSLPERRLSALAELVPRAGTGESGARVSTLFEIAGPWNAVRAVARSHDPDAASRGEAVFAPNALRLPATVRAYAP
ncbi:AsmA family protein [Methylobacterium sp. BTF04]|uniref:AsmA family protein n=1 Tax=Methylobacterium sp. BTF04 TaxID=2708300 RepID=UPI0013D2FBF0|nr:AsmA-like C-terminal region-containing protein [Methylobacterium sp. BTF04]NEU14174.1 AsmA family protein [Methylobacterium sp. BTF04]